MKDFHTSLGFSQCGVQTSRQELHDEVEVPLVLEAVEHLNNPGAVCLHQDVPLRPDVSHLLFLQHVRFPQNLHGVNVARVFFLYQPNLDEATAPKKQKESTKLPGYFYRLQSIQGLFY